MFFRFCLIIFLLGMAAAPACAQPVVGGGPTGDMFYDEHWIYDRPSVPSDIYRGPDMLPRVPLMSNQNADVFDHAPRYNTMGNEDMLPRIPLGHVPDRVLVLDP
ncbi:MAG: hypothetical protein PHW63_06280 [Alphaproteobacteria bacterium]|nr:hypothetical protein [Alphaproteobacteria bacterium]